MQTGFRSPTARAYPPRGAVHHLPDCSDRIEPDNYLGAGPAFGRNHRHAAYAQQRAVRSEPRHSPFGSLSPRTAAPQSTHGLSRPSARDHGAPPRSRRFEPGQRHRPPTQGAFVKDIQHRVDLLTHEAGGSSRSPKCANAAAGERFQRNPPSERQADRDRPFSRPPGSIQALRTMRWRWAICTIKSCRPRRCATIPTHPVDEPGLPTTGRTA